MAVRSWPFRVRSSGQGDTWPAVVRTVLRWACSATGRKPTKAATAAMPTAPTAADGDPSAWASGTTATDVRVPPGVMVTVETAVGNDGRDPECSGKKDG